MEMGLPLHNSPEALGLATEKALKHYVTLHASWNGMDDMLCNARLPSVKALTLHAGWNGMDDMLHLLRDGRWQAECKRTLPCENKTSMEKLWLHEYCAVSHKLPGPNGFLVLANAEDKAPCSKTAQTCLPKPRRYPDTTQQYKLWH